MDMARINRLINMIESLVSSDAVTDTVCMKEGNETLGEALANEALYVARESGMNDDEIAEIEEMVQDALEGK